MFLSDYNEFIMRPYQSFPGEEKGITDSLDRLNKLCLPDLTGKRVLDIGCNEGFFCIEAKRRGAKQVIGMDKDPIVIEKARTRAPDIDFRCQSWDAGLPEGKFDFVLLLSSLHYASNPQKLLDSICDCLSPDGKLILECGARQFSGKQWFKHCRDDGKVYFPTLSLLEEDLLRRYAFRRICMYSMSQSHNNLFRFVYHCSRMRPIVLIITGGMASGKTYLSRNLGNRNVLSIDHFMGSYNYEENPELTEYVRKHKDDLRSFFKTISDTRFIDDFIISIVELLPRETNINIIEGGGMNHPEFLHKFVSILEKKGFYVWVAKKISALDNCFVCPQT